jgi:hypothetical protein
MWKTIKERGLACVIERSTRVKGDGLAGRERLGRFGSAAAPRLSPYSVATRACLLATEIVVRASPVLPRSTERAEAGWAPRRKHLFSSTL